MKYSVNIDSEINNSKEFSIVHSNDVTALLSRHFSNEGRKDGMEPVTKADT